MATNVGTLQAKLTLDVSNYMSAIDRVTNATSSFTTRLADTMSFHPEDAVVLKNAQTISDSISRIFDNTRAHIEITFNNDVVNEQIRSVFNKTQQLKRDMESLLSNNTVGIDVVQACMNLDALKSRIEEVGRSVDENLKNIRPSVHIGNANSSLRTVQNNVDKLKSSIGQSAALSVNVDTSSAASAMDSLQEKASSLSNALNNALSDKDMTGLWSMSNALQLMSQAMQEIIGKAQAFSQTLLGLDQTLQEVSAIRTYTSQLGQAFDELAQNIDKAAASASNFTTNLFEALNSVQMFGEDDLGLFEDFANKMDFMSHEAKKYQQNMQNAGTASASSVAPTSALDKNLKEAARNADQMNKKLESSVDWASKVKQIVGGIVISQAFYQITGEIRTWIRMANDFAQEMEQAAVSFKYLMGSASEANSFIQALQDFAVQSPLDTEAAEKSTRLLMTMGISAQNAIPVLRILTDTAAVAGGEIEDTIYRISLALGQMLQSGTVKMQEIRQLVNANIPIYSILEEELGLTAQQVAQIGKQGVNSAKAVNAILTGLQKRFSGASAELQKTVKGSLNAIKDSFLVLYNVMISGPYDIVRIKLNAIADAMTAMVAIIRRVGPGGLFETLFPPETQVVIRNFLGILGQLGRTIKYLTILIGTIFGDSLKTLVYWFTIITPPIAIFLNALSQLLVYLYTTSPWVRRLAGALGAVLITSKVLLPVFSALLKLVGFTRIWEMAKKAVLTFGAALKWVAKDPIRITVVLLGLLIGVIAYLTGWLDILVGKIKNVILWWEGLNKTLNKALGIGYDPSEILQPWEDKASQSSALSYLGQLQNITDAMDDVGKAAEKTKKKLKSTFLQSFDEVYRIKEDEDSSEAESDLGINPDDYPIQIFDDIPADLGTQVADLSDALNNLAIPDKKFWEGWRDVFSNWPAWLPAVLAGSLGAIIGAAVGGVKGGIIGAAAGALAGLIWNAIADAFKLTPEQKVKAAITSGISASLGAILGYALTGSKWGAVIGGLAGLFVGEFWSILCDKFQFTDATRYTGPIAMAISVMLGKALAKGLGISSLMGIGLGATIGALVVSLIEAISHGIETGDWSRLSVPILGGLGAALGFCLGGPLGAAVGGALGMLVGGLWDLLYGAIKEKFSLPNSTSISDIIGGCIGSALTGLAGGFFSTTVTPLADSLALAVTGAVEDGAAPMIVQGLSFSLKGALKGGILGAIAGLAGGLLSNALNGWVAEELDRSKEDLDNGAIGQSIGGLIGGIVGLIIAGGNPLGAAIGTVVGQLIGGFAGLFISDVIPRVKEHMNQLVEVCKDAFKKFDGTAKGGWEGIKEIFKGATDWLKNTAHDMGYIIGDIAGHAVGLLLKPFKDIDWSGIIDRKVEEFKAAWSNLFDPAYWEWLGSTLWQSLSTLGEQFDAWFTQLAADWDAFWADFDIVQFGADIINGFWEGISLAWDAFWEYVQGLFEGFIDGVKDALDEHSPSKIFAEIGGNIVYGLWEGIQAIWETFTAFIGGILDGLIGFFTNFADNLSTWASNTWSTLTTWATNVGSTISTWATNTWTTISGWVTNTATSFGTWATNAWNTVSTWFINTATQIGDWVANTATDIGNWISNTASGIGGWVSSTVQSFGDWASQAGGKVAGWIFSTAVGFGQWFNNTKEALKGWVFEFVVRLQDWWNNATAKIQDFWATGKMKFFDFFNSTKGKLQEWAGAFKSVISSAMDTAKSKISSAISGMRSTISSFASSAQSLLSRVASAVASAASSVRSAVSSALSAKSSLTRSKARSVSLRAHATGGIFNREHIASISEGNKAEAIIPLQNQTAMQPFVDAVANGLTSSLAPIIANVSGSGGNNMQPLYVGTLIADDRGLKELERKMQIIQMQEDRRKG